MKKIAAFLLTLLLVVSLSAQESEVIYLSGTGLNSTKTWQFRCSAGMNSGKWGKIAVPSQWELQGYGQYNYGRSAGPGEKPLDEYGEYRYAFKVPSSWKGGDVRSEEHTSELQSP